MATAVETPPLTERAAGPTLGLLPASLVGGVLLLASVVLVGNGVSRLLEEILPAQGMVRSSFKGLVEVLAVVGALVLSIRVTGSNGPRGSVGGAFLTACCAALTFLLGRAVGLWMEGNGLVGQVVTAAAISGMLFGSYKLLTGARGKRWMVALESQGWFRAYSYKKSQGQRVRKWTMIGVLLVGGTGVYAVYHQSMLPDGDWAPRIPYTDLKVPLIADVPYTVTGLLLLLSGWLAWRSVNVPTFTDFLIATEAEMNKVSWTPLKKLVRDTVVVLVFTALLTAFLLTVDLFWGWTLNQFGVLPDKPEHKGNPTGQGAEW